MLVSLSFPPEYHSAFLPPAAASLPFSHDEIDLLASSPSSLPSVLLTSTLHQYPSLFILHDAWIDPSFWEPIYLSTLAGLSTCVGASVAFFVGGDDDDDRKVGVTPDLLAFSLALAGSVMITLCVVSIIPECLSSAENANIGSNEETWDIFGHVFSSQLLLKRTVGFVVGWGVSALLSQWLSVLPEEDELSAMLVGSGSDLGTRPLADSPNPTSSQQSSSWRLTILLFLSLLLHNFPEGLAVAFSAAASSTTNVSGGGVTTSPLASIVAISIALHNIPEGIAIAIPCMAARPNQPYLAFCLASLSGLAEPVGAFIGLTILRLRNNAYDDAEVTALSNGQDMGDALAFVAGIMLAVAVCELLPEASRQQKDAGNPNSFSFGLVIGVGVMVLTELYLDV